MRLPGPTPSARLGDRASGGVSAPLPQKKGPAASRGRPLFCVGSKSAYSQTVTICERIPQITPVLLKLAARIKRHLRATRNA